MQRLQFVCLHDDVWRENDAARGGGGCMSKNVAKTSWFYRDNAYGSYLFIFAVSYVLN